MLGSFTVGRGDEMITMPTSLAATTIKIVALRGRILAEELVEQLWPGSPPGVGMRRLRNVLWRIRVACGGILIREDRFILLSPAAVTDVSVFRRLASEALEPSMSTDAAARARRGRSRAVCRRAAACRPLRRLGGAYPGAASAACRCR